MPRKEQKKNKKSLSQAGMARINLTFYTLSSIRKLLTILSENINEAFLTCEILGQSLLLQIGLDDNDILNFHKEHINNIHKSIASEKVDENFKKIARQALDSLPFIYDEEEDILVLSKDLDGEVEKIKKKFIEGFT